MSVLMFTPNAELTFATVETERKKLINALNANQDDVICCELSHITHCDSAGLALLIEAKRVANQQNKHCQFVGVTPAIQTLAEFCGVDQILLAD